MKILIKEEAGWKLYIKNETSVWFKGYVHNFTKKQLLIKLSTLDESTLSSFTKALDGHFSFVIQSPNFVFAAVDKIRSTPLFWRDGFIGWHAPSVANNRCTINKDAILPFRMSGYTINEDTIFNELNALVAGEYVIFKNGKFQRKKYFNYEPWNTISYDNPRNELANVTIRILKKMIKSLNGRQVVIPLSAGYDSRLIVSGLKHLGYKNVKCYSYGTKGNFEAKIAESIAKKLGYQFKYIPLKISTERKFYNSDEFSNYLDFSDTCVSIQYYQSLSTISRLKNWIDEDAIFVNGNTGDFISGGHIKNTLISKNPLESVQNRSNNIASHIIDKHYSLWESLKTDKNIKELKEKLINRMSNLNRLDNDHGIYENFEFLNRQSKYVISGQRCYEFYGYEWRLPLWDDEYLSFWQGVPFELKREQKLYKEMLIKENWGGVWDESIPVNKTKINPSWIVPLRFFLKLPFVLFGKKYWHRFESGFLYYFMDITRMICIKSYREVYKSVFNGPRHHASYQSEDYINSKLK